jgi:hypothetical protein
MIAESELLFLVLGEKRYLCSPKGHLLHIGNRVTRVTWGREKLYCRGKVRQWWGVPPSPQTHNSYIGPALPIRVQQGDS